MPSSSSVTPGTQTEVLREATASDGKTLPFRPETKFDNSEETASMRQRYVMSSKRRKQDFKIYFPFLVADRNSEICMKYK